MLVLTTPTETILHEINELKLSQKDVAKTAALIISSGIDADWKAINSAIVTRWSKSARERVLGMAWKIVEGKA